MIIPFLLVSFWSDMRINTIRLMPPTCDSRKGFTFLSQLKFFWELLTGWAVQNDMHPSNPSLPIYIRTYRQAGINAYRHTRTQIGKGFRVTTSLLSSHLLFAGHQSSSMLGPGSSAAPGSPSEMPVWDPRRWGCWWCAPWIKPLDSRATKIVSYQLKWACKH